MAGAGPNVMGLTLRRGLGLQVEVFKKMVSLRALHLDEVAWRRRRNGRANIGALLSRMRPLTNLQEMSLSVATDYYSEFCSFWEHSGDSMAKDLCSLRQVDVVSGEQRSSFELR